MGLGQAGLCFWNKFSGQLPLLGRRFRVMGSLSCKKSQPVPSLRLYVADIEWNIRTFEGKLGQREKLVSSVCCDNFVSSFILEIAEKFENFSKENC